MTVFVVVSAAFVAAAVVDCTVERTVVVAVERISKGSNDEDATLSVYLVKLIQSALGGVNRGKVICNHEEMRYS